MSDGTLRHATPQGNGVHEGESHTSMKEEDVTETSLVASDGAHPHTTDKEKEAGGSAKKAAKRRKVNHACVYCRRSHMTCDLERPCARCIKRDIGHLCHDEPREPSKRQKSEPEHGSVETKGMNGDLGAEQFHGLQPDDRGMDTGIPAPLDGASPQPQDPRLATGTIPQRAQPANYDFGAADLNRWDFGFQNQFADMQSLHPYTTFNTTEINNEYNLLGDFLSSSLLDDGGMFNQDNAQALFDDPLLTTGAMTNMLTFAPQNMSQMTAPAQPGNEISRPPSAFPVDNKARDKFFLTAADPAGNDSPEERMNRLLKAKYDAGMLKPFNYVKGYARLNSYMEKYMKQVSRQKILRQLNQFRPKFREAMHNLTDIQLVKVEMWFERCLMEYDRVFASMAIPACCWRRTGEIYRGNKEMAELIHVPMDNLRDGKLALHEIMVEDSLVSYWDKFGAIAFDQSQKAILTSCTLKNPDASAKDPFLRCCFSFTIRRDTHNIPAMIVGNFLPILPASEE